MVIGVSLGENSNRNAKHAKAAKIAFASLAPFAF
jgi:hypothetical protein